MRTKVLRKGKGERKCNIAKVFSQLLGRQLLSLRLKFVTRASLRFPTKHPLLHLSSPAMLPLLFVDSPIHQCGAFV